MKFRILVPTTAAAVIALAGAASAQSAGSIGAGAAQATNRGAVVEGAVASQAVTPQDRQHHNRRDRDRNRDRRDRDVVPQVGTATTYGAGAVYTDRNSTSAGVTSGATASGPGVSATSSTVDAYGETSRDGTSADIYGNSTATTGQTPAPAPRRPR